MINKPTVAVIDIKPGSCPNPLNVKDKGALPVAVLRSKDFDVFNIDPASIRLEGVAPNGVSTAVTQKLLEHSSPDLTNKVYMDVDPVLRHAVDQIPASDWL